MARTEAVDLALRHLAGDPMPREEALAMLGSNAIETLPGDPLAPTSHDSGRQLGMGGLRPGDR